MTLKRFNADVEGARQSLANTNVSNIQRGESDGEAVFDYFHPRRQEPLRIQILTSSLDDYPANSSFLVFTDCDLSPEISIVFESAAAWTGGKDVRASITAISKRLDAALGREHGENGNISFSDSEDSQLHGLEDDDDDDDQSDGNLYDNDFLGDDDGSLDSIIKPDETKKSDAEAEDGRLPDSCRPSLKRLREDLFEAKRAGFHIGVLRGNADFLGNTFSLSLRVSYLGIPEETLDAWEVGSRDYLVLLLRLSGEYQGFEDLASTNHGQTYRFGKCSRSKPSMDSVTLACDGTVPAEGIRSANNHVSDVSDDGSFKSLYISPSINRILKDDLVSLVQVRLRDGGGSWDSARETLHQRMQSTHQHGPAATAFPQAHRNPVASDDDSLISPTARDSLNKDHVLDRCANNGALSTPLAAMQLALRQFARCTEYCMICHKRTQDAFEAVKPFVCPNPLCLYQYMALGLGPSAEHEIISQPQTVDLLISFFYTAVSECRKREWPKGLAIKVPAEFPISGYSNNGEEMAQPVSAEPCLKNGVVPAGGHAEPIKASVDLWRNEFVVTSSLPHHRHHTFHPNDWVVLARNVRNDSHYEYTCRVISHHGENIAFEFVSGIYCDCATGVKKTTVVWPVDGRMGSVLVPESISDKHQVFKATVHPFDSNLDDLESDECVGFSLLRLLRLIPPVQRTKEYFLAHPGSSLTTWGVMPPAAVTLLRWIIKSNRSSIVQIESPAQVSRKSRHNHKVLGVPDRYMQFRFALGAADKEFRFQRALESMMEESDDAKVPTIFAWHGSPCGNWHSIIRTGLDFSQTLHGRAFGNGVYMSSQLVTSEGYGYQESGRVSLRWPNSQLQVSGALCLCEVVNWPNKFVSTDPHIVVGEIDWIQVRYLFVRASNNMAANPTHDPRETATGPYVEQDARFALRGSIPLVFADCSKHAATCNAPCNAQVPLSVIPRGRQGLYRAVYIGGDAATRSGQEPIIIDSDSEADDSELVRPQPGKIPEKSSLGKHRRSTSPEPEPVGAMHSSIDESPRKRVSGGGQNSSQGPSTSRNMFDAAKTSFRPGTLDMTRLPRLPAPSWALPAASKSVSRELKALQKLQAETPLHELGWHISFDHVTNLFRWIIELHSFESTLPLAQDMQTLGCGSIVCEVRFPPGFPMSPPFLRVIRPRFLPFSQGGGGHVTAGGAMCMELLTSTGWSPAYSMESVILQVRLALCNLEPRPARLLLNLRAVPGGDYGIEEAACAYVRVSRAHGWDVPLDFVKTVFKWT